MARKKSLFKMFGGVLEGVGNAIADPMGMPPPAPMVAPTVSRFSSVGLYVAYFFGGLLVFFIVFIIIVVLFGKKTDPPPADATNSASGK